MKAIEAGRLCHIHGYIARISDPDYKRWKNTIDFYEPLLDFPGDDWEYHDPDIIYKWESE